MNVREFWSVEALYVTTNALYWKFLEMQNSMHLTLLKHQNTKTSLYELSKNHWVITLLGIFGSDRKNLQFTVPLDHPVAWIYVSTSRHCTERSKNTIKEFVLDDWGG